MGRDAIVARRRASRHGRGVLPESKDRYIIRLMTNRLIVICPLILAAMTAGAAAPRAAQPAAGHSEIVPLPTLGGKQFWADELFFHPWRIQRNVLTGHCRLLDAHDLRHAWGTFPECRANLEKIKAARKLPPMQGKAVIVLHGLFRSRSSMNRLCKYLADKGGYVVFNVGYPSTRRDVSSHARALQRIVENLDGIEEINFVGHSMGNIVIRHYLADRGRKRNPPGARPGRFVMLGPPNQGSLAAVALAENAVFKILSGKSGEQLGAEWAKLEGKLATPDFQFGIVAGGMNNTIGFNPLLPGDDDGTVTTASTRLAGARDFIVVPVLHSFLVLDGDVLKHTLRFLQHGHFVAADKRCPIAENDKARATHDESR